MKEEAAISQVDLPPVPDWSGVQPRVPAPPPLPPRRATRPVKVGSVIIGGDAPISVQSMTVTKTDDWAATLEQVHQLAEAGCEIVRISVPDAKAADDTLLDYLKNVMPFEDAKAELAKMRGNIDEEVRRQLKLLAYCCDHTSNSKMAEALRKLSDAP